jgi:tetratricopeptide (TPR) repeat protein
MEEPLSRTMRAAAPLLLIGLWCQSMAGLQAAYRLEEWLAAVERHEPGTFDAAAREIASWPDQHLAAVIQDVGELAPFLVRARIRFHRSGAMSTAKISDGRRLTWGEVQQLFGLTDDEADAGDPGRLVLRAVLLHTDISVNVDWHDPLQQPSRPATSRSFLIADGRHEGVAEIVPHWRLARVLLDLIPQGSPHAEAKRRWYVAAAAFLQSRGGHASLMPHLARGAQIYPHEAELHFYSGSMHETLASRSIQRGVRSLPTAVQATLAVKEARTHLEEARARFRSALEAAPDLAEARVRLGYVLGALGRHNEAVAELQAALATPADRRTQYYGALLLGAAQRHLGQREAARNSNERAAALYPHAQSPRLALSSLARAAGQRSAATRILVEALPAEQSESLRDPWWEYFWAPLDRADRLLGQWRTSVVERSAR